MDFLFDAAVLDKLFPFSFVADEAGRFLWLGRSLPKVCPNVKKGSDYLEHFCVEQPVLGMDSFAPPRLVGEFVKLSARRCSGVALRGQVVAIGGAEKQYLFALIPDVAQAESLEACGIDFGDFALGEPIIDGMLLWRLFKQTRQSLEATSARLAWRDLGTDLLHELSAEIFSLSEDLDILSSCMVRICQALGWQVGQVFTVPEDESGVLKPAPAHYLSDGAKFAAFHEETQGLAFAFGQGLPGRAAQLRLIEWFQDATRDPLFIRRGALAGIPRLTGVAVPIVVDDQVLAVIELFTERVFSNPDAVVRLLEIVRRQVEAQISRQHARMRERHQEALLAHSAKMSTLGELAAGVAHEIRSPLFAISVTAEVLSRMPASCALEQGDLATHAGRIKECVSHISQIVSDLQSFSRDAARDPMSECSLADIVASTLHLSGTKFMNKEIELRVDDIPKDWVVTCRAPQVSQVLLNLLSNAYDAAMQGAEHWVQLSIVDEGSCFAISVSDSGPGVPEEVRKNLMQPFFTTKPPGRGTGLGLSISRNIMQAHGGDLVFQANAKHTTFTARLPKAPACAAAQGT